MGNVKKLYQYLLPVLLLPLAASLIESLLTSLLYQLLGSYGFSADTVVRSILSVLSTPLYLVTMAGVALPALWGEAGKIDRAKAAHRALFLLFCALIAAAAALFLFFGERLMGLYVSPEELLAIGKQELQYAALAMLVVALLSILTGQIVRRYSLGAALTIGLVMMALWTALGVAAAYYLGWGASGIGVSRGGVLAAARIAPFLMIPVRTYAEEFSTAQEARP